VSDKFVCGWNYPGSFLDELRKTTKLRIMPGRNGTSTPRAYGVKPVTNERQQAMITAARQSQTCTLLLPCAQGYRPRSKCSLPPNIITAARQSQTCTLLLPCAQGYRPRSKCSLPPNKHSRFPFPILSPPYHYAAGWAPEESRFDCRQGHDISSQQHPDQVRGPPQPSIQRVRGSPEE
jgi:hypothetical protein